MLQSSQSSRDYHSNNGVKHKHSRTRYAFGIMLITTLCFVAIHTYVRIWRRSNEIQDHAIIRIFPQDEDQIAQLRQMKFIAQDQNIPDYIEVYGRYDDVLRLNQKGIPAAALPESQQQTVADPSYPTYEDIYTELQTFAAQYPDLMKVERIGNTQKNHNPIWAVKISANVNETEDEPAVMFMAGHHAREPVGMQVCLGIIRYLLTNSHEFQVENWLSRMAIWVVPCINPDGYEYVINQKREFPWWRKNLRDNNNNGVFEPEIDGVDLNRNYDFNWTEGGRGETRSWYYRGESSGSESETKAIMDLAERERFVVAIDYHSFGEVVMFPWALEMRPPDEMIIKNVAITLARKLKKHKSDRTYDIVHLNGKSGQSANWLYANLRSLSLIVEVGKEFFPERKVLEELVAAQMLGAEYILDRVLSSSLVGHIYDNKTRRPLPAMIQLEEDFSPVVSPSRCVPDFGRFHRLVLPGRYTITAMMEGYKKVDIPHLLVNQGQSVLVDIPMEKLTKLESTN